MSINGLEMMRERKRRRHLRRKKGIPVRVITYTLSFPSKTWTKVFGIPKIV